MDCRTARILNDVRGNRSAELPAEDAVDLDLHLNACGDCHRLLANEQKIDRPIAVAMRSVPLPINLKARILDQLAMQRGAWYRKRVFIGAAAAACLLVAVGILTWQPPRDNTFNPNLMLQEAARYDDDSRDKMDGWLTRNGLEYRPPIALNPHLLSSYTMADVQGRQVPTVVYRTVDPVTGERIFARVFLVRAGDFDLDALPKSFGGSSPKGYQLEILRDKDRPDQLAYVILLKGDQGLRPFLLNLPAA